MFSNLSSLVKRLRLKQLLGSLGNSPRQVENLEDVRRKLAETDVSLEQLREAVRTTEGKFEFSGQQHEAKLNELLNAVREISTRLAAPPAFPAPGSPQALYKLLASDAERRSADIVLREMPNAMQFFEPKRFWRYCLKQAPTDGAHCEFGVYSADSINFFAKLRPETTFDGFDSFEGLPEDWAGYFQFDFNVKKKLPEVLGNVDLHVGWFENTLPAYADKIEKVSFLHIDCDLYSSTDTVFKFLGKKIQPGAVIVFDEYFLYPNFQEHEFKAFAEFLKISQRKPKWIACCGQRAACILE